ncbi:MAG: amino acid permease [Vulcanimicrobiota bacterium]
MAETQDGLQRGLKPHHMQFISIGGIIGSAYFLGTGYVLAQAGPAAVVAYLLGGFLVYLVMLSLGELAVHIPTSGSFVTYANEFIHPAVGCGVGWSYWINWVVFVPSEMIAAGIIMNHFVPTVGVLWWAAGFGALLTALNLMHVGNFGEMEFWLCLIKIVAIGAFVILAILIALQLVGSGGALGLQSLPGSGGFFPHGIRSVFFTMVIILVNFQGTEIIGLAAGECKDPEKTIPAAVNAVCYRIIALYVIPVLLVVLIFPWNQASLKESVFALALASHGLGWAGAALSFVVLTAAISCSNSGIYATSRALYSLAREGMAPAILGRTDPQGVPRAAILVTVSGCWLVLALQTLDKSGTFYQELLAVSGFTGTVCWVSICWAQARFRQRLAARGFGPERMRFRVPGFPYVTYFAIFAQVACLAASAVSEDFRKAGWISLVLLLLPMLIYAVAGRKRDRQSNTAFYFEKVVDGEGL